MERAPMKTAVIGCGMISKIYLTNLVGRFSNIDVVAVCDLDAQKAAARSEEFGVPVRTMEDVLADKTVELVVVLTPAPTHYGIIRQALLAGKHVYTEKTLTTQREQAAELVALAEEKGVYLGAAPDTFLGASLQQARRIIDSGVLGEITGFNICSNRNLDRLTSRFFFLRLEGGGICYDYGVYYLTALVSLLGGIDSVVAHVENRAPIRINNNPDCPEYQKSFSYPNEGQVTALLRTRNGVSGTFTLNGESIGKDLTVFSIYGKNGVLKLANPNFFGGALELLLADQDPQQIESTLPYGDNCRGIGPSEMVDAIRAGRVNRASKELSYHVLDVIESIMESSRSRCFVDVHSDCPSIAPF